MSGSNATVRPPETQSGVLSRIDRNELKSIKVAIMRRNVPDPNTTAPLQRSLDDPAQLNIHYRPDEGVRPIFDRDDVVVNKETTQEERMIRNSPAPGHSDQKASTSRNSSRSSRSSERSPQKHHERQRASPQPHTSREEPRSREHYAAKYRRSNSPSRKSVYKTASSPLRYRVPRYTRRQSRSPPREKPRTRSERSSDRSPHRPRGRTSRSPNGYQGPSTDRRPSSRSPPPAHKSGSDRTRHGSRSPHRSRALPERKRPSRSPPPQRRTSRGRSRSHSPYRSRSRYSRSPHRHEDYRKYERSKRSRSPRKRSRYSPEHHSRRSPHDDRVYHQPPRIPNPYFEGAEYWIPDPTMQPRFMPRQMLPPGAFPYGPPFRPAIPMMIPPRMQFRPRIVYNRPQRPKVAAASITEPPVDTATTSSATVTPSVVVVEKDDAATPKENDLSTPTTQAD